MDSGDGKGGHKELMHARITETWECLNSIWTRFGYDEENFLRRQNTVVKHVSELLQDMAQEAQDKLNEQQQKLDSLMQEIMQLAKDLSIEHVPELDAASGKTLLEMERVFAEIAKGLRARKAIRMEKYNKVNEEVIEICEEMNEEPMKIQFEGIPADSQVAKLEQHLGYLHHEKSRRLAQFHTFRKSILELIDLLETTPKTQLEQFIESSGDEINQSNPVSATGVKVLSLEVLRELESIENNMKLKVEANKQQGENYWQKIRELWSRLSVDEEMQLAFSEVHEPFDTELWTGIYKPSVLKGLKRELERLEEEKRLNMGLFIKQVREELCNLWINSCFLASIEVRFIESNYLGLTSFTITDFNSEIPTEDLLEKHEKELEYWKNFVERNKKIIDMVIRRGHMFAEYKTLDQKSDDPSRLANRGGALLKEEKERKKLEKTIPKLEAELKSLCESFEQDADEGHGMTKFLVYGRTINEMIEQDWEEFHEEKRLRKEAKKIPKDGTNKTMMGTTQVGNAGSRKRPAPQTPSSARGLTTPSKKNKTTALTPGKTFQSPAFPAPSASAKRPLTVYPSRLPKLNPSSNLKPKNSKTTASQYFPTYPIKRKSASRKKRRSMRKLGNGSSLNSSTLHSSSSSSNDQKSSLSQPNLLVSSLDQLNFSEVIRGHGPIAAVSALKQTPPVRPASKENFIHPSEAVSRSGKKTPKPTTTFTRQASAAKIPLPTKLTGKEQVPPSSEKKATNDTKSKDTVISPVASYSEFTDHLLCQSTLNSSTVVPLYNQNKQTPASSACPTTPTKSSAMSFTPAKLLDNNCF